MAGVESEITAKRQLQSRAAENWAVDAFLQDLQVLSRAVGITGLLFFVILEVGLPRARLESASGLYKDVTLPAGEKPACFCFQHLFVLPPL